MNRILFKPFAALLVAAALIPQVHAQKIKTVAGNGTFGYSGDGGAATSAKISSPPGVWVDNSGNLYIADGSNARLRKVDAATHVITTVAGTGVSGFSGDGGPATSAQLNTVFAVCVDPTGNIYISDGNHRIRKVDAATGNISTVVGSGTAGYGGDGGLATAAYLGTPIGIAVDNAGNIYFSDYLHVRKVTKSTGIIDNYAGTNLPGFSGDGGLATAATFQEYIGGIWLDASGNLYVCDVHNYVVRKISSTGTITTIAGMGGMAGSSGDGGLATAAMFKQPQYVCADGAGNVYIADPTDQRIRKIDASGKISTICGDGTSGYTGDYGNASAARLNVPSGMWVNASGDKLFVADQQNHVVREISSFTAVNNIAIQPFSIAPNPSSGVFTIQLHGVHNNAEMNVYNVIGAKVFHTTIKDAQATIDLNNQPSGVYFVHVVADGHQTVQKLTISK